MEHTRNEIWDLLYKSGPQTIEQLAAGVGTDQATVNTIVCHEWFEVVDAKVQIATTKPPSANTGMIG